MSKIQDLRDKIHRLNGKEFTIRDLNSTDKKDYFSLRDLCKMNELIKLSGNAGRNTIYQATEVLNIRQSAKESIPELSLKGWREVMPYYFKEPSKGVLYSIY